MFRGIWDYVNAIDSGRTHYSFWRKTPSQANILASVWFDMSLSPGNPKPQYYAAAPLVAQQMKKSTDGGFNHGPSVSPYGKRLKRFLLMGNSAFGHLPFLLCDYLLYYPFVDTGTNDEQFMDNTLPLPRFTSGDGVQMMAVSVASNSSLFPSFIVNYTNSDGVSGRTSRTVILNASTANGSIITNNVVSSALANVPFIGLQSGDRGVRSVQSVTFTSGTDVGLFALVLVKPLLTGTLQENLAPTEIECLPNQNMLPIIYDDAFLNILFLPSTSINAIAFHGEIETVWNI